MNGLCLSLLILSLVLVFFYFSAAGHFWTSGRNSYFCLWTNSISNGQTHYMFLHQTTVGKERSFVLFDSIWNKENSLIECITSNNHAVIKSFSSKCWKDRSRLFSDIPDGRFNISKLIEPDGLCVDVGHLPELRLPVRRKRDNEYKDSKTVYQNNGETFQKPKRSKRAWMIPGTLWCGSGNKASDFSDLGLFEDTDKCCREHDHCEQTISSFQFGYGVFNSHFFTLSHCNCDSKFRRCLHNANDRMSDMVGYGYFNVLKMRCFEFSQRLECAERTWWGMCKHSHMTTYALLRDATDYNSTLLEDDKLDLSIHHTVSFGELTVTNDWVMSSDIVTEDARKKHSSMTVPQSVTVNRSQLPKLHEETLMTHITYSSKTEKTDSEQKQTTVSLKSVITNSPVTKTIDRTTDSTNPVITDSTNTAITDLTKTEVTDSTNPVITDLTKTEATDSTNPAITDLTKTEATDSTRTEATDSTNPVITDSTKTEATDSTKTEATDSTNPAITDSTKTEATDSNPAITDSTKTEATDSTNPAITDSTKTEATDSTKTEATDSTNPVITDLTKTEATDSTNPAITDLTKTEATDSTKTEATDSTNPVITDLTKTEATDSTNPAITDSTKTEATDSTNPVITDQTKTETNSTSPETTNFGETQITELPKTEATDPLKTQTREIPKTEITASTKPQTAGSAKKHLHPEMHTSQKGKLDTCESYKDLDSCHYQIPALQEKFGLRNTEHITMYHCNCTARLARELAGEDEADMVHFWLLDFVSQSCFILPQNCTGSESCSTSFSNDAPFIGRWNKRAAVWRHLAAPKRIAKRFNNKRSKRKNSPIRLHKKCLRMHSKLHRPKTIKSKKAHQLYSK
ncbi:group 3 secretory phospholipase A2 [Tachysurus fulvidraco]|uniref:group 3 secretory phospholipase A2 n=1 Tax=Tachysurus fulvidraco TaxID=1234273 RepID=UPI001FEE9CD0|nr:group 3 secretory phospholipase A2 [Tachysurus fulvidraco]